MTFSVFHQSRSLLNVSLDEDSEGRVRLGPEDDPYDEDGNLRDDVCMPPAIEQFPEPIINKTGRRYGGLIIHIVVAVYMFVGLAIVCDDYFVPALDKIADGNYNVQKYRFDEVYSIVYNLRIFQYFCFIQCDCNLQIKTSICSYYNVFHMFHFLVLNMDPDVAGATFMAAGSSGPELATAVIGVFVAKVTFFSIIKIARKSMF